MSVAFSNEAHRNPFFNAGGSIYFTASRSGGAQMTQNTDWTNLLSAMGTIQMNFIANQQAGTTTGLGMYDLTTSYQTIYTKAGLVAYHINFYKIEAQVANGPSIRFNLITFGDPTQVEVTLTVS